MARQVRTPEQLVVGLAVRRLSRPGTVEGRAAQAAPIAARLSAPSPIASRLVGGPGLLAAETTARMALQTLPDALLPEAAPLATSGTPSSPTLPIKKRRRPSIAGQAARAAQPVVMPPEAGRRPTQALAAIVVGTETQPIAVAPIAMERPGPILAA